MDSARFTRVDATTWRIEPHGAMRVPAIIYADENLIRDMDDKVFEQAVNVATLPGIVAAPTPCRMPIGVTGSRADSLFRQIPAGVGSKGVAFSSACHGAGRALSRHAALKRWSGRKIVDDLASEGILIRSPSTRGIAEEAPGAYKDVGAVVAAAEHAGLARRVARLRPLICIKG